MKKKILITILSLALLLSAFTFFGCNGNGYPNGNGTDPTDTTRPNIGAQTGTLNRAQAEAVLNAWDTFVLSNNVGAFNMIEQGQWSERELGQLVLMNEWEYRNTTDGTNWYINYSTSEELTNGHRTFYSREWFHQGNGFAQIRTYIYSRGGRDREFEAEQKFVALGGAPYASRFLPMDFYLDVRNTIVTRHGNFVRFLFDYECDRWDEHEIEELIFDGNNRLIYIGGSFTNFSGENIDSQDFWTTRITWGGVVNVPAPPSADLFQAPPASGISMAPMQNWWGFGRVFRIGENFSFSGQNIISFPQDTNTHHSWYNLSFSISGNDGIIIQQPSLYWDWFWSTSLRFRAIRAGTVTLTITSIADPSLYWAVQILVSDESYVCCCDDGDWDGDW